MADRPTEPPAAALRLALERYLRQQLTDSELQTALCSWVRQIKGRGLRAEQLILRFNDVWSSVREVQRVSPLKQRRLRARLVSTCIAEYYQDVD